MAASEQKKALHIGRHKSAIKRARQNPKRRRYNRNNLKEMRGVVKAVRQAISVKDAAQAQTALQKAIAVVAKTAQRGSIPKRRASRYVSRLTKAVSALAA